MKIDEKWIKEKEDKLFEAIIKTSPYGVGVIRHFSCPTKKGIALRKDFVRQLLVDVTTAILDNLGVENENT